jgi:class 3 adenylate cyclase
MIFSIAEWGKFDIDDRTTQGRLFILFFILTILSIPLSMSIYQSWRFARMNKDLALQLEQVKILSRKTLEQEREKQLLLENRKQELEEEVLQRTADLRAEKKKSDDLLLNILPAETAEELKSTGQSRAKRIEQVTVMFTDFKNFTQTSEKLSAEDLVHEINACYSAFDTIITSYGIEKIKTIGDAYMCAGGLPVPGTRPEDVINAALEMQQFIERTRLERIEKELPFFELRIGIHTGTVVAGIVGLKKFAYDIWGDTVNIASRMESSGETGKINISGATYELVKNKFNCIHRGKILAKNKGEIDMYFVER